MNTSQVTVVDHGPKREVTVVYNHQNYSGEQLSMTEVEALIARNVDEGWSVFVEVFFDEHPDDVDEEAA